MGGNRFSSRGGNLETSRMGALTSEERGVDSNTTREFVCPSIKNLLLFSQNCDFKSTFFVHFRHNGNLSHLAYISY